jgi:hypothetical protein
MAAKEIIGVASASAVAGAAGYNWINAWFSKVGRRDFYATSDQTTIKLERDDANIRVLIHKEGTLRSMKTGCHDFERVCLGKWSESSSLDWESADGLKRQTLRLETKTKNDIDKAGQVIGHLGVIYHPGIQVSEGDKLILKLDSEECVEYSKGFYLQRITTDLDEALFNLSCKEGQPGLTSIECMAYNEQKSLLRIMPSKPTKLKNYHEGVDILITWI